MTMGTRKTTVKAWAVRCESTVSQDTTRGQVSASQPDSQSFKQSVNPPL